MIARKLGENRVTVYSTIQGLVKKQFIFEANKNKVAHYTALPPQKLLEKSQEKTSNLEAVMSTLLAMNLNADQKPWVQLFEGVEGLKMCYEDTLQYPQSTLKAFLGYGKIQDQLKNWLDSTYLPKRIQQKILAKVLVPWKLEAAFSYPPLIDSKKYCEYTQLGFVQDTDFDLYNEINLYGEDRVLIVMFRAEEMIGMLIKSKLLYDTLSALFDLTWKREIDESQE